MEKEAPPPLEGTTLYGEWNQYLKAPGIGLHEDPLEWWRKNASLFPNLAEAARTILAVPASSAPSERVFSKLGRVAAKERVRIRGELADLLTFLSFNEGKY